ncbi:MAG: CPBP family intramembrane glutamic endopeptidase [Sarcina sp.]
MKKFLFLLINVLFIVFLRWKIWSLNGLYVVLLILFFSFSNSFIFKLKVKEKIVDGFKVKKLLKDIIVSFVILLFLTILTGSSFHRMGNIYIFINFVIAACVEEIYFRVYLGEVFKQVMRNKYLIALSIGVIFSIMHTNYPIEVYICFTLFAMILYLIYDYTKSIAIPVFIHIMYNCFANQQISDNRDIISFFIVLILVIGVEEKYKFFSKLRS